MKERNVPEDNKVNEWDSRDPETNEKLQAVIANIKYSFMIGGVKIGFVSMTVDSGIMTMNNVLLAFHIPFNEEEIMKFIIYRKVILVGNNLIYPS